MAGGMGEAAETLSPVGARFLGGNSAERYRRPVSRTGQGALELMVFCGLQEQDRVAPARDRVL